MHCNKQDAILRTVIINLLVWPEWMKLWICSTTSSQDSPMACLKFAAAMSQYEWSPWLRCSHRDMTGRRSWMTEKMAKPGPMKDEETKYQARALWVCFHIYSSMIVSVLVTCFWPGILVTSRRSSNSSSSVGGWCWRGQFDTAAVSCSNRRIHTCIRPAHTQNRSPLCTSMNVFLF